MMLGNFREKILSWGAKLLLGLLIISFGLWGIGDYTTNTGGDDQIVAEIGGQEISSRELESQIQVSISRMREVLGQNITNEQALAFGIVDQTLNGMVQEIIFSEGARNTGLIINDDLLNQEIRSDKQFKNRAGQFDRNVFQQSINRAGYSEGTYVDLYRRELLQKQLLSAFEYGISVPVALTDSVLRYREERRVIKLIKIKHTALNLIPDPPSSILAKFHSDNAARFSAPEYRAVTLLRVQPKDISDEIEVSEEQIKNEYDSRISEFSLEERRKIQQILVSEEPLAQKVMSRLKMGNDFIEVAKGVANFDQEALELGDLTRGELAIRELGDAAFLLNAGNYTVPIRSSLGWHILRVTNITPATKKALGEVRNVLKRIIQLDLAADSLITLSNQIEDELGAGASIRDAAGRLNLKVEDIPAIDKQGLNELGKAIDGISDQKEILNAVFATSEGEDSDLNDYGSSSFFMLHVNKVTKPTLRPLDKIINDVRMAWKRDHRAEEAESTAKNLVNELNNGISPKILASKLKVDLLSTRPFTRTGEGLKRELPRELISKVFASKVRNSVLAAGNGVHLVAFVSEKRHPITSNSSKLAEAIRAQLNENILGDLKKQLAEALRKRLGVTINRENIKQIFSKTNTP